MKPRSPKKSPLPCLAAAALAAFHAPLVVAAPDAPTTVVRRQRETSDLSSARIQVGTSRREVESLIGAPADRLSRDVWVYWNFTTLDETTNPHGFDTLLLTFVGDRVVSLKLVPGQPVRQFLAQQRRRGA